MIAAYGELSKGALNDAIIQFKINQKFYPFNRSPIDYIYLFQDDSLFSTPDILPSIEITLMLISRSKSDITFQINPRHNLDSNDIRKYFMREFIAMQQFWGKESRWISQFTKLSHCMAEARTAVTAIVSLTVGSTMLIASQQFHSCYIIPVVGCGYVLIYNLTLNYCDLVVRMVGKCERGRFRQKDKLQASMLTLTIVVFIVHGLMLSDTFLGCQLSQASRRLVFPLWITFIIFNAILTVPSLNQPRWLHIMDWVIPQMLIYCASFVTSFYYASLVIPNLVSRFNIICLGALTFILMLQEFCVAKALRRMNQSPIRFSFILNLFCFSLLVKSFCYHLVATIIVLVAFSLLVNRSGF